VDKIKKILLLITKYAAIFGAGLLYLGTVTGLTERLIFTTFWAFLLFEPSIIQVIEPDPFLFENYMEMTTVIACSFAICILFFSGALSGIIIITVTTIIISYLLLELKKISGRTRDG